MPALFVRAPKCCPDKPHQHHFGARPISTATPCLFDKFAQHIFFSRSPISFSLKSLTLLPLSQPSSQASCRTGPQVSFFGCRYPWCASSPRDIDFVARCCYGATMNLSASVKDKTGRLNAAESCYTVTKKKTFTGSRPYLASSRGVGTPGGSDVARRVRFVLIHYYFETSPFTLAAPQIRFQSGELMDVSKPKIVLESARRGLIRAR